MKLFASLPLLAALVLSAPSFLHAVTIPNSVFTFSGTCTDCTGTATATLTLTNYTQGNTVLFANLVSFQYDGTNLLAPFLINQANLLSISGIIPVALPNQADFFIQNTSVFVFHTDNRGFWGAGPDDFGTNGVFAAKAPTSGVPEPATVAMMALGLGLIGIRRLKS